MGAGTKVLVTGASGFIGSRLVEQLVYQKYEVVSLVRNAQNANPASRAVVGDLTDKSSLKFDKLDTVFHLASLTPIEKDKELLRKVNLEGTKNLFESLKGKVRSFIYISGVAVFEPKAGQINEDSKKSADTEFVKLRLEAEQYLRENCKKSGINFAVAYLADLVYGDAGAFQSIFVERLKNKTFKIPGSGDYIKNFVHIDDAVGALMAIMEKPDNQFYLVTDSNPVPFKEFVNFTADQLKIKHPGSVPAALAKIALGVDLVKMLTKSARASNQKISKIYEFKYPSYRQGVPAVLAKIHQSL